MTDTLVSSHDEFFRASLRDGMLAILDTRNGYVSWSIDAAHSEFGAVISGSSDDVTIDDKRRCIQMLPHFQNEPRTFVISAENIGAAVLTIDNNQPTEVSYFLIADLPPLEVRP